MTKKKRSSKKDDRKKESRREKKYQDKKSTKPTTFLEKVMDLFVGGTKKSKESNPKDEPTPKAKPKALSKRPLHMPKQVKIIKNEKTNKEEGSLYDSLKSTRTTSSLNAQSPVETGPLSENQFPPVEVPTKESLKQTLEHVSSNPACDSLSYEQTKKNTALAYVQLSRMMEPRSEIPSCILSVTLVTYVSS